MVCAVILISRQIAIWIRGLPPTDHFRSVRSTSRDSARDSIVDAAASKSFTETFGWQVRKLQKCVGVSWWHRVSYLCRENSGEDSFKIPLRGTRTKQNLRNGFNDLQKLQSSLFYFWILILTANIDIWTSTYGFCLVGIGRFSTDFLSHSRIWRSQIFLTSVTSRYNHHNDYMLVEVMEIGWFILGSNYNILMWWWQFLDSSKLIFSWYSTSSPLFDLRNSKLSVCLSHDSLLSPVK